MGSPPDAFRRRSVVGGLALGPAPRTPYPKVLQTAMMCPRQVRSEFQAGRMLGEHIGSYEILEEIGKGGMATVYRARQASVERDVAVKAIRRAVAADADAIQRFQREAKLIARLEHPHILPVYDFDAAHDPPYLVMRYLDSGTLDDVLDQGPLPLDEVAYLMRQVCSALDYAHRQGIVHRDIKPSNIMIDQEGNAFVSDLGIARIVSEVRRASDH